MRMSHKHIPHKLTVIRQCFKRTNISLLDNLLTLQLISGYFDKEAIHVLLEESVKMKEFDHPNVLTLFGVCVDAGPAPYIVMPYMAKGSLQSHLRRERHRLIVDDKDEEEDVSIQEITE